MAFLSSGPVWPATIAPAIPAATNEIRGSAATATDIEIVCDPDEGELVVTIVAQADRVGCAWAATVVLSQLWPTILEPAGVELVVNLPGMTFTSSPDVMSEVAGGCDRRRWIELADVELG